MKILAILICLLGVQPVLAQFRSSVGAISLHFENDEPTTGTVVLLPDERGTSRWGLTAAHIVDETPAAEWISHHVRDLYSRADSWITFIGQNLPYNIAEKMGITPLYTYDEGDEPKIKYDASFAYFPELREQVGITDVVLHPTYKIGSPESIDLALVQFTEAIPSNAAFSLPEAAIPAVFQGVAYGRQGDQMIQNTYTGDFSWLSENYLISAEAHAAKNWIQRGDSGGPLVLDQHLVGINSLVTCRPLRAVGHLASCGYLFQPQQRSIHTNVLPHVSWIRDVIAASPD